MKRTSRMIVRIATFCLFVNACAASGVGSDNDASGTGGSVSSGSGGSRGGAGGSPGTGGSAATGGATASGGSTAQGGATGLGGTIGAGGTVGAGGITGTGGATGGRGGTGGATSSGGTSGTAGSLGRGGTTGAGGLAGAVGTGGAGGRAGSGGTGVGGTGTGSGGTGAGGTGAAFPFNPPYMLGADITYTLEDEAAGATYSDGGKVQPLEQIMANYGFNYIRIRTFVNPAYSCGGTCPSGQSNGYSPGRGFGDIAHTITWAKRVKACGFGILLDFHMSDTWASIGNQFAPHAWIGLSAADQDTAAHDYVKSALAQMVAAGVKPDMVQIGNETDGGMSGVHPGSTGSNWANFANLANAGIRAVRETDPKIIVFAQNGRPRDPDNTETPNFDTWVDWYLGGHPKGTLPLDEDGICGSTYGTTNSGADWNLGFSYVINTYNKPVWSCEYTNQRVDTINGVLRALPKGMGRGSFMWEPTRYPALNGGATGANSVLFDNSGGNGGKYTTNAAISHYATLAKSYGLPVPSGTCH